MFFDMTKRLRRVRAPKKAEEGELVDSNDEEEIGQVKEENGEDVSVIIKGINNCFKKLFFHTVVKKV